MNSRPFDSPLDDLFDLVLNNQNLILDSQRVQELIALMGDLLERISDPEEKEAQSVLVEYAVDKLSSVDLTLDSVHHYNPLAAEHQRLFENIRDKCLPQITPQVQVMQRSSPSSLFCRSASPLSTRKRRLINSIDLDYHREHSLDSRVRCRDKEAYKTMSTWFHLPAKHEYSTGMVQFSLPQVQELRLTEPNLGSIFFTEILKEYAAFKATQKRLGDVKCFVAPFESDALPIDPVGVSPTYVRCWAEWSSVAVKKNVPISTVASPNVGASVSLTAKQFFD